VAWQTVTLLVIAVVVGLPLGAATGRWAWNGFASSIGVVPVTVVPLAGLAGGLFALLVAGTALAGLPAVVAARTPAASALRRE
jgi:hypothetical protein